MQGLDGDVAVGAEIMGEIDRRHPAGTELTLDAVTAREGSGQPRNHCGNRGHATEYEGRARLELLARRYDRRQLSGDLFPRRQPLHESSMMGFDRNASRLGTNRLRHVVLLVCAVAAACSQSQQQYDLVINGGRVIDPETKLDAVRSVGIVGDRIARVSAQPLTGQTVIDAKGLVVSPGFIDLHQHDQSPAAYRLKALDGVTSALEMEAGVPDFAKFVAVREGKALINYGATVSQEAARVLAFGDTLATSVMGEAGSIDDPPSGPATNNVASDEQVARQIAFLDKGLTAGALGVGMGLEYTPGATRLEIIKLFQEAAKWHRPVFVHMRSVGALEPGSSVESVGEMIAASAVSGAPVHIVHINSSCIRFVRDCLTMIEGARARGLDVTTEAYPYGAGMTSIASALFNPGWRERRSIDYDAVEIPETGERLTKARFDALHGSGQGGVRPHPHESGLDRRRGSHVAAHDDCERRPVESPSSGRDVLESTCSLCPRRKIAVDDRRDSQDVSAASAATGNGNRLGPSEGSSSGRSRCRHRGVRSGNRGRQGDVPCSAHSKCRHEVRAR